MIPDETFVTHTQNVSFPDMVDPCVQVDHGSYSLTLIIMCMLSSPAAIINTPVCLFFSPVGHRVCNPLICKFAASSRSSWLTRCLDLSYIRISVARFALVTFDERLLSPRSHLQ